MVSVMFMYAVVFFIAMFLLTAGLFWLSLGEAHSPREATDTTDDAGTNG